LKPYRGDLCTLNGYACGRARPRMVSIAVLADAGWVEFVRQGRAWRRWRAKGVA